MGMYDSVYSNAEEILITGGVGDFIVAESFISKKAKQNLKKMYLATRADSSIRNLMNSLPKDIYPNLEIETLWNDFDDFFCFFRKNDLFSKDRNLTSKLSNTLDFSISIIFPMIKFNLITFQGSSFIDNKLCNTLRFKLPKEYIVIVPFSKNDARDSDRGFNSVEWKNIISSLERKKVKGVILDNSDKKFPEHPNIINLQGRTTLVESVEITKKAKGYIGIDSCLSVIASFCYDSILVKSVNDHLYKSKGIYYHSKKDFSFIRRELT